MLAKYCLLACTFCLGWVCVSACACVRDCVCVHVQLYVCVCTQVWVCGCVFHYVRMP